MTWSAILEAIGISSSFAVTFAVNLLIQTSVLIVLSTVILRLLRFKGAAVQSAMLRATLVAVLLCPLVIVLFDAVGVRALRLRLPLNQLSANRSNPALPH